MDLYEKIKYEFDRGNLLNAEKLCKQGDSKNPTVIDVKKRMADLRQWNKTGRPSSFNYPPNWEYFPKFQDILDLIQINYTNDVKILDVGCYVGYFLHYLSKLGYDCYGCDIQKDLMLLLDSKIHNIMFKYCNAEDIDHKFKRFKFDVITFIDSLEHVFNDKKAIKAAKKLLKPNGAIIIHVPGNYSDNSYEHLRIYNKSKLRKLLPGIEIKHSRDENLNKTYLGIWINDTNI